MSRPLLQVGILRRRRLRLAVVPLDDLFPLAKPHVAQRVFDDCPQVRGLGNVEARQTTKPEPSSITIL
jgi:hypothetical protein